MSDSNEGAEVPDPGNSESVQNVVDTPQKAMISKSGKIVIGGLWVLALSGAAVATTAPGILAPVVEMLPASMFPSADLLQPKGFDGGGGG